MSEETAKGRIEVAELTKAQAAAGRRMAEAKATIPDLQLSVDPVVDVEPMLAARVAVAVAAALRQHPRVNSGYRDGSLELHSRVNLAVAMPEGSSILMPTLFDADGLSVEEVDAELKRLGDRAASGDLSAPETAGATFALFDLGAAGADRLAPIVSPSQSAALGVGAPRAEAVIRDGAVVPGHRLALTLVCDARALSAVEAAAFLDSVRDGVAAPGEGYK